MIYCNMCKTYHPYTVDGKVITIMSCNRYEKDFERNEIMISGTGTPFEQKLFTDAFEVEKKRRLAEQETEEKLKMQAYGNSPQGAIDKAFNDPFSSYKEAASALKKQVGGEHYLKMKIQPFELTAANNLDAWQHTIIKYVMRFREKNGKIDLEKAKHTIDLLIQKEYKDA